MRLQKDFDHTEHYVFKHELRTIEVNVENLDIIHLFSFRDYFFLSSNTL